MKGKLLHIALPLTVLFSSISNLLVVIILPNIIDPVEYAEFSLWWANAIFASACVFEWARVSVIRFAGASDPLARAQSRCILLRSYLVLVTSIIILPLLCMTFLPSEHWLVVWAVVSFSLGQSVFEGRQALSRADFDDSSYFFAALSRSVLNLVFLVGVAAIFKSGVLVLFGQGLAFLAAYLIVYWRDLSPAHLDAREANLSQLRAMFAYGVGIAAATLISYSLPSLVRVIAIATLGREEVGAMMLALDVGQRAIFAAGLAVNLLVLQRCIRIAETGRMSTAASQQVLAAGVILAPVVLLALNVEPWLRQLLVSHDFLTGYTQSITLAIVSGGIITFRTFGVDTLFVLAKKPLLALIGPATTVAVTAATCFVFLRNGGDARTIVLGLAAGSLVGLIVSAVCGWRVCRFSLPTRDVAGFLLSSIPLAIVTAIPATPGLRLLLGVVSCVIYVALIYWLDIARLRSFLLAATEEKAKLDTD